MSGEQKPAPMKNFQEMVAEAIIAGDLEKYKKCHVSRNDINRQLLPHRELEPKPQYNPNERCLRIRGPTIPMLMVMCEQDEMLRYCLENQCPNLAINVQGYNIIHVAAMSKDHKCLQELLKYKWVQEHIDAPCTIVTAADESNCTTALHIAVSNRRYHNVCLLLSPFKKAKAIPAAKSMLGGKKAEETPKEEEDEGEVQPANFDMISATGATPLYIATFLKDVNLVRLLLAAGADSSIVHKTRNETAIDLITRLKEKNDENKAKKPKPSTKGKKKVIDPIDEIFELLTDENKTTTELKQEIINICPDLADDEGMVDEDAQDEEECEAEEDDEPAAEVDDDSEEEKEVEVKTETKSKKSSRKDDRLDQIVALMKSFSDRLDRIERNYVSGTVSRPGVSAQNVVSGSACVVCSVQGTICPTCHKCYCDRCKLKPVHSCH